MSASGTGETHRKLVHVAVGSFAFLLKYLTWPQAALFAITAFLFNWQVLPRIGGRSMWREHEHRAGWPRGILLYPLSVFGLVLVFHDRLWMAAAIWGVLAWGDGMATLVGRSVASARLPWNPDKGWAGSIAFVVFGTLAATVLACWTARVPQPAWPGMAAHCLIVALLCAIVESLPTTLDDNLTVPLTGALALAVVAPVDLSAMADPLFLKRAAIGLAVNIPVALLARLAGSIDLAGAISAVVIGTVVTAGLGLGALGVMMAFFVIGTLATKWGYRIKAARGIAQEKGGARGWRNAWANGGIAALLAWAAGLSPAPVAVLLAAAYAAAVATAAADTCSSEVGKAYGRRTFLITTFQPVPPGTEGAVSLEGTLGGLAGGALVAAVGAWAGLYGWRVAALVAVAALLGSLAESVIGTAAERRGWMGNDMLNALNTAIGALLAVAMVKVIA